MLVGIVRRRGNMDEVEIFGGSERMMSVSCFCTYGDIQPDELLSSTRT